MDSLIGYVIQPLFLLMNNFTLMGMITYAFIYLYIYFLLLGVVSVLVGGARPVITWAAPQVFLWHYSIFYSGSKLNICIPPLDEPPPHHLPAL